MSVTIALQPGLAWDILAASTSTGGKTAYALPARACRIGWATAYQTSPVAVEVKLQVSIDNISWLSIDTSSATTGESRQVTNPVSAQFIRCSVTTNTTNQPATVTVLCRTV